MSDQAAAYAHVNDFRWHQGNPDVPEAEAALRDAYTLLIEAEDLVARLAYGAHQDKALTWEKIAELTGCTRQTAVRRYDRALPNGYLASP